MKAKCGIHFLVFHIAAISGDLVIWFAATILKLGVIESIMSYNGCAIRYSYGQRIKRMVSNLTPILCNRVRYLIKNINNALGHFTSNHKPSSSYANVFQSGFLKMVVAIMFLLLPVFRNSTYFLSYCEMWKIIFSELRQNARYLLIYMINCCLMFILNGNKEFHFITIKVVQYNIIIQLFQFNFFSCNFYLTFFHFFVLHIPNHIYVVLSLYMAYV